MKWYFGMDEAGGQADAGECAKLAVLSARAVGGLEPVLLYHGSRSPFTVWMEQNNVAVVNVPASFLDQMTRAEAAGTFKPHSLGHWLRISIPMIETDDEFVLYTDCDVFFLRPLTLKSLRPKVFAAAPEFHVQNWNYFNSGVMLLNVPAMRVTFRPFLDHIRQRIEDGFHKDYDDQTALNEAYRHHWEHLDPRFNWKAYWDFNPGAAVLHFHGPKPSQIEAIATGGWVLNSTAAFQLAALVNMHADAYVAWLVLISAKLRAFDPALSQRIETISEKLVKYKSSNQRMQNTDISFMDFQMFTYP